MSSPPHSDPGLLHCRESHEHTVRTALASPPGQPLGTFCVRCILKVTVRRFAVPADREKRNHRSSDALGNHPPFRARSVLCLLYMHASVLHLIQQFTPDQKQGVKMARNWPRSMALIRYRLLYKDIPVLHLTQQFTPDQKRGVKMARNWPRSICQTAQVKVEGR